MYVYLQSAIPIIQVAKLFAGSLIHILSVEGTGNVSQVIRSDAMGCGPGSVPLGKNCSEFAL